MQPTTSVEARVRIFPQLSYHYGLGFEELTRMPRWAVELYIDELPRLLAEEQQAAIQAAAFPNYDKQDQKRISRNLTRTIRRGRAQAAPKVDIVAGGEGNPLAGMVGVEIVQ
jgi:hypothetical protein